MESQSERLNGLLRNTFLLLGLVVLLSLAVLVLSSRRDSQDRRVTGAAYSSFVTLLFPATEPATATLTPTHPPEPTETHLPESTATWTRTPEATETEHSSPTRTATQHSESTATWTRTPEATETEHPSPTRTATQHTESTATWTRTPEATETEHSSPTRTATQHTESTATSTRTPEATETEHSSPTRTATEQTESTATWTRTPEATETQHSSPTRTASRTPGPIPSVTTTATRVPEHSATPTATRPPVQSTPISTLLPTWTLTPAASDTATATLEPTRTTRPEETATFTATPLSTATQEPHPDLGDLAVFGDDIWTIPASPRQGEAVGIGVNVHNIGYKIAHNVAVHIYAGNPSGGHLIGSGNFQISQIEPRNQRTLWTGAVWDTTGQKDPIDIWVVVDPDHEHGDANYNNNTAHRHIVVQPLTTDQEPPEGTILAGGNTGQTGDRHITLHLDAHDNPGGSGVSAMVIVEYRFDAQDGIWRQGQSSGWVGYANTYAWELLPGNGVKYLMVWFADNAGNISPEPAKTSINYLPPEANLAQNEMQLFRVNLSQGTRVTITLQTITGDADLFVWQPGSQNVPDYYSINSGQEPDEISFVAAENGIYQFQVFGYQVSVFNLRFSTGEAASSSPAWLGRDLRRSILDSSPWLRSFMQLSGLVEQKVLPGAPTTLSAPPDHTAVPDRLHTVYLPWSNRVK
ncbi:MAG: hypothetical protein EXR62_03005 [Chloroflexi bacterium]|nr:hypothetical protein [Chloroflexota bacterium]